MNEYELKSPKEIDTEWYEIDFRLNPMLDRLSSYKRYADEARSEYDRASYNRTLAKLHQEYDAEIDRLLAASAPLEAEWKRRGGWSRYYLCATDGGHIHRLPCSTLRATSRMSWMPALSGLDENGMVAEVGWKACTVCFPSAPTHPAWAASWAASEAAYRRKKTEKWAKGRAMREKKVSNIRKRLARAEAKLADPKSQEWDRISARSDIQYGKQDLAWAERELARWDAKSESEERRTPGT